MPKILLVEDNEMNRDMLSRRLQRRGYQVVLALDGQSGVEKTQSQAPDLVLMDMSLLIYAFILIGAMSFRVEPTGSKPISDKRGTRGVIKSGA